MSFKEASFSSQTLRPMARTGLLRSGNGEAHNFFNV
jgi:hypothetical protein